MDVIYNGQAISFYWRINRNASDIPEDFTKADLKVFFIGNDYAGNYDGKYYFTPIDINCDPDSEQAGDYVHIDIDAETLPPGTYCVEAVWIKNRHELLNAGSTRTLTRARKDRVFKVADYEPEASDYSESDSTMESEPHKVIITSGTTSYGYDGMSAYETAVFEGSTVMSEKEWIEKYENAEDRINDEMDEDTPGTWANAELLRKKAEGQLGSSDPDYATSRQKKEADRQTAESNRASAENSRSSAETQRQKNEGQLGSSDPNYATSRIKKENDRQTAESGRVIAENGRIIAENTRVQNEGSGGPSSAGYSTSRIKKELDRQSAESSRATAETSRQEYEGQGDYSDTTEYPNTRRAKEAARQTAETARATAETARQKAEGQLGDTDPDYATSRIKQEIDRQAAEAARELAETARENAKISSTTIEYAVGDSGTTPPSSGWQSTVPSYTTGDFLWGRTTITFGDGTSKVLYAIGSVPDVAVSQNASTGKTTITVGSDSYDVATEPVSVSQNTETGHTDINIGDTVYPVPSVEEVSQLGQEVDDYTKLVKPSLKIRTPDNYIFNPTVGYITESGAVSTSSSYKWVSVNNVKEGDIITCWNVNRDFTEALVAMRFICAYDANGDAVSEKGVSSTTDSYTVPAGIKELAISLSAVYFSSPWDSQVMIIKGATAPQYFKAGIAPLYEAYGQIIPDQLSSKNKTGYWRLTKASSTNGDTQQTRTIHIVKNLLYTFTAKVTSFSQLSIGQDSGLENYNSLCIIDSTKVTFIINNNRYESEHGITIANYINVRLTENDNTRVTLYLESNGQTYTTIIGWYGFGRGGAFRYQNTGCVLSDLVFTISCRDLKDAPVHIYGDSYIAILESTYKWTHWLIADGYGDNTLINAFPGASSSDLMPSLKNIIEKGLPRLILWACGMNDGADSDTSTPNATWLAKIKDVITICEQNGIEPVLATIPTVPSILHEGKNAWVRNSGYRYVDFSQAVGANSSGVWYSDMLDNDNVHPTEKGAKALYHRVLCDLPDVTFKV